ncbi:hypothetical protein NN561_017089 [Cricetulus griseus]
MEIITLTEVLAVTVLEPVMDSPESSGQLDMVGYLYIQSSLQKLHLEMLADQPRTTKYHNVILQNKESLKDKVILDVGCGTGIISLFCAHHARPKAVYAVEASEMAQHTGQLVLQNGFADTITVFQQKVEDVVLPEKVDVLVSEWMGTCLLVMPSPWRSVAGGGLISPGPSTWAHLRNL